MDYTIDTWVRGDVDHTWPPQHNSSYCNDNRVWGVTMTFDQPVSMPLYKAIEACLPTAPIERCVKTEAHRWLGELQTVGTHRYGNIRQVSPKTIEITFMGGSDANTVAHGSSDSPRRQQFLDLVSRLLLKLHACESCGAATVPADSLLAVT